MNLGLRHAALSVQDIRRALDFYCGVLGFEPYHVTDADWAMVCRSGTTLSFVRVGSKTSAQADPDAPDFGYAPGQARGVHPGHLGIVFDCPEDVQAIREKLVGIGHRVGRMATHRDGSIGFYLADLDGNALELIFIPARSYPALPGPKPGTHAELRAQLEAAPAHQGAVLLCHGSRDARWREPMEALLRDCRLHAPQLAWALAYMEFCEPGLEAALQTLLASRPCTRIEVIPVFLSSGGHVLHDLPHLLDRARQAHPGIQFRMGEALGENALVREALVQAGIARILTQP